MSLSAPCNMNIVALRHVRNPEMLSGTQPRLPPNPSLNLEGGPTSPPGQEAVSDHEEQSTQNKRARGTPESYDSEDQPLRKPPPYKRTVHSPWLSSRDRAEQQLALDHLMRKDGIYDTKREKILKIFRSKIASKVKVATGSGEKEGSKYHCVEIDLINTFAARSILWDLPRTGRDGNGAMSATALSSHARPSMQHAHAFHRTHLMR